MGAPSKIQNGTQAINANSTPKTNLSVRSRMNQLAIM
jgi:hypothetical protein